MANFRIGQHVRLLSGSLGTITRILVDHPTMAHLTRYQVRMDGTGQLIGANGVDVSIQGMVGQHLDGSRLTGVTYGVDQHCTICHGPRENHQVFETERSQDDTLNVVAQLMLTTDDELPGQTLSRADREARFMVGVLLAGGLRLVAASGIQVPASLTNAMASLPGYTLCTDVMKPVKSRGGVPIADNVIAACQIDNVPLACAAPKLIDFANRRHLPMPYHMSEIWFDPKTFRRKLDKVNPRFENIYIKSTNFEDTFRDRLNIWLKERDKVKVFTEHGDTRVSCDTCKGVLPMLLCGPVPPARR